MTTLEAAAPERLRTVTYELGNLSELNRVSINPAHITHMRLTGTHHHDVRKLEIYLANGMVVGINFDDPSEAEVAFHALEASMHSTVPA